MILYDDKYNFLGMSSDTLGFLGYEDIGEFLSMQSDFANLFVNKEGYIYKFDNFAWIDFVLYSGCANKKAVVTLKNGQEAEISVSIKELFLAKELGEAKKLYSVKIISDNFNEISGTPRDTSDIKKSIGGFSLGGLVKKEQKEQKEPIEETDEFTSLIQENKIAQENSNSEGFILDIADNELISKNDINPEIKEIKNDSEDFKLNFLNDDLPLEKEPIVDLLKSDEVKEEPIVDLLKSDEVKEDFKFDFPKNISSSEPILDFLKNSDKQEKEPSIKDEQEASKEPEVFNFLNEDKEKESDLIFNLPDEDASKEEGLEIKQEQNNDSNFSFKKAKEPLSFLIDDQDANETNLDLTSKVKEENLEVNFLKIDEPKENIEKELKQEDTMQKTNLELNFATKTDEEKESENKNQDGLKNKKEIIKQIKKDIKEIDAQPKNKEIAPIMPNTQEKEEQKLNFLKEEKEEIGKIDEIKSEDKSFTNTLNDLFNNDNKKSDTLSTKQEKDVPSFLNEIKKDSEDNTEEFNPLSSLGLNADDEFELMSDFISDTNESIAVIEEFIKTDNLDKINYPLVKIKSSAEILNLDAIIDISNTIKKEALDKDSEGVINHINTLRKRVEALEKNLIKTVA